MPFSFFSIQCRNDLAVVPGVELLCCQLLGGVPAVVVHGVSPGHWIVRSVLVARGQTACGDVRASNAVGAVSRSSELS